MTSATPVQPAPAPRPSPAFRIAYPASLAAFNTSPSSYLAANYPPSTWDGLATCAIIFNHQNRVLLLRRAKHDSMPGLWEPPGGAADEEDGSLFVSAARELWEEAGLVAKRVVRVVSEGEGKVPGSRITNRTGEVAFVKFAFEVQVEGDEGPGDLTVEADPNEHDAFVWATEDEVKSGEIEVIGGKFELTYGGTKEMVLDAFRRRRDEQADTTTEWVVRNAAVA